MLNKQTFIATSVMRFAFCWFNRLNLVAKVKNVLFQKRPSILATTTTMITEINAENSAAKEWQRHAKRVTGPRETGERKKSVYKTQSKDRKHNQHSQERRAQEKHTYYIGFTLLIALCDFGVSKAYGNILIYLTNHKTNSHMACVYSHATCVFIRNYVHKF